MMTDKFRKQLTFLLLFFGSFFILLSLQEGCYRSGEKISAEVVAKKYVPGMGRVGSGTLGTNSRHLIQYRFTTSQGETKEATEDVLLESWSKLNEGDSVDVEYLPSTGDSRMVGQTASAPVFLFLGVVLLAGGIVMRRAKGQS